MKIKHPREHDQIVQWVLDNPETFLKNIGYKEPFTELAKKIQVNVKNNNTVVGIFDIQLIFQCASDYVDPYDKRHKRNDDDDDESVHRKRYIHVNIIINVNMESSTEQLRELKKIYFQHKENMKNSYYCNHRYVIVSTNDNFKLFFTDNDFIFYKF